MNRTKGIGPDDAISETMAAVSCGWPVIVTGSDAPFFENCTLVMVLGRHQHLTGKPHPSPREKRGLE